MRGYIMRDGVFLKTKKCLFVIISIITDDIINNPIPNMGLNKYPNIVIKDNIIKYTS